MSEEKHTPGPWWVTDSGIRDRGGYICHTRSATHYPGQDERFEKETLERAANKKLIAAAPELLEALQGLDEAYCRASTPLTREERTEDRKRLIAARAAITKATGQPA